MQIATHCFQKQTRNTSFISLALPQFQQKYIALSSPVHQPPQSVSSNNIFLQSSIIDSQVIFGTSLAAFERQVAPIKSIRKPSRSRFTERISDTSVIRNSHTCPFRLVVYTVGRSLVFMLRFHAPLECRYYENRTASLSRHSP